MLTLFGVGLLQFYHVYRLLWRSTQRENWNYAILTTFLVADIVDTITKCTLATSFGRDAIVYGLSATLMIPRTIFAIPFTSGLISAMTHLFYMARLYALTITWDKRKNVWIGLWISLILTFIHFGAAIFAGWVNLQPFLTWHNWDAVVIVWLTGSATVDFLLCFMMVAYFRSQRSIVEEDNNQITRWITITLQAGLFPGLIQITELALYLSYPIQPYSIALNYVLPKSYLNCVLILFTTVLTGRDSALNHITGHTLKRKSPRPLQNPNIGIFSAQDIKVQSEVTTVVDRLNYELPERPGTALSGFPGSRGHNSAMSMEEEDKAYPVYRPDSF